MARHKSQKPKDRKNVSNRVFGRYAFRDGQMHSIHGMTNFQVDTAESQVFGFYSNTGQGASGSAVINALGKVIGVAIAGKGSGFTEPPLLSLYDSCENGSTAGGFVKIKNGEIEDVVITNPGGG